MEALACHPSNQPERIAFSATWKGKRILFKSPKSHVLEIPRLLNHDGKAEFLSRIKQLVYSKLYMNISLEEAREISTLPRENQLQQGDNLSEMDSAWMLLQDEDYLSTVLFAKNDIFPRRIGTCGNLYAIEYAETIKGTSALFSLEDDEEEWERRVRLAVLLLDLLVKLDDANLQLCNVQFKNFGSLGNRLQYLSPGDIRLRNSFPKNFSCKVDHDCGHFDCQSLCNATTGRCNSQVEGDNLQLVCEKIYLGWTAAGRIILPGLLVSAKASSVLASLLRRCADPTSRPLSTSFRRALYNTLIRRN